MSKTREDWLIRAVRQLGVHVQRKTGEKLPEVRVSCGFPSRSVRKVIGQCWAPSTSGAGVSQVFISPLLDDPVEVLAVLLHELVHSIIQRQDHEARKADPEHKATPSHGAAFKGLAEACGLEGKMTATVPGETLTAELKLMADKLGEYPHAALVLGEGDKKQTTRMLKLQAVDCDRCEYVARTTQKWLDEAGLPKCPHDVEMVRV